MAAPDTASICAAVMWPTRCCKRAGAICASASAGAGSMPRSRYARTMARTKAMGVAARAMRRSLREPGGIGVGLGMGGSVPQLRRDLQPFWQPVPGASFYACALRPARPGRPPSEETHP